MKPLQAILPLGFIDELLSQLPPDINQHLLCELNDLKMIQPQKMNSKEGNDDDDVDDEEQQSMLDCITSLQDAIFPTITTLFTSKPIPIAPDNRLFHLLLNNRLPNLKELELGWGEKSEGEVEEEQEKKDRNPIFPSASSQPHPSILSFLPNITKLTIRGYLHNGFNAIKYLFHPIIPTTSLLPNLTVLDLSDQDQITADDIKYITDALGIMNESSSSPLPHFHTLKITARIFSSGQSSLLLSQWIEKLPSFQTLDLDWTSSGSWPGISAPWLVKQLGQSPLISFVPQLDLSYFPPYSTEFVLNSPHLVNDCRLKEIALIDKPFRNGEEKDGGVGVPYMTQSTPCFPHLLANSRQFSSIETLRITSSSLTDNVINTLCLSDHLSGLRSLIFHNCHEITDQAIKSLTQSPALSNLTLLDIRGCRGLTSISLAHLADESSLLKGLKELYLNDSVCNESHNNINDNGNDNDNDINSKDHQDGFSVLMTSPNISQLTSLTLQSQRSINLPPSNIPFQSFYALTQSPYLGNLRSFTMQNIEVRQPQGPTSLIDIYNNFHTNPISHHNDLTKGDMIISKDPWVNFFYFSRLTNLKTLVLNNCGINDNTFAGLLLAAARVSSTISSSSSSSPLPSISPATASISSFKMSALESVSLSFVDKLSDSGIIMMSRCEPFINTLSSLTISGIPDHLTPAMLTTLRSSQLLTNLTQLTLPRYGLIQSQHIATLTLCGYFNGIVQWK